MDPDGQLDYARFYNTHFDQAAVDLDADKSAYLSSAYRSGNPAAVGTMSPMAKVTRNGGRFGAVHHAPPTQADPVFGQRGTSMRIGKSFDAHGFRPPCSWYVNDKANIAYAREAHDESRLSMPVLFVNADYDQICSILGNRQGDPCVPPAWF